MTTRFSYAIALLIAAMFTLGACSKNEQEQSVGASPESREAAQTGPVSGVDYHSFANTGDYVLTHLELDLAVDFTRKVLSGQASLSIEAYII